MADEVFDPAPNGEIGEEDFMSITTTLCGVPKVLNQLLFKKIDIKGTGKVTKAQFQKYYAAELQKADVSKRMFTIIAKTGSKYIEHDDFKPILKILMDTHPGLEFLKSSPEFQDKYGTVL